MAAPMAALAAGTTGVTAQVAVQPTVTSCSASHGAHPDGVISITISGNNFIQDSVPADGVSVSGSGVTVGAFTVVSTTEITTTFTIDATAAQGARNVLVTLAGQTGTGTGVFTVDYYITVNAPSAVSLGLMTVGVAKEVSSSSAGTVESNYTSWAVTAKDANQSTGSGHMLKTGAVALTNKLYIGSATAPTTTADTGFDYTSNPATLPFFAKQTVLAGDEAGSYAVTVEFTGNGS
jgi:hypothetical protein